MRHFTQSNLAPFGNCWQTAVACILEVEPEVMPPQSEIESWPHPVLDGWGSYSNCLNGYLRVHHRLAYSTIYAYQFVMVRPIRAEHVLCGPTVRTERLRAEGVRNANHCVAGVNGVMVWDPHPTHAGLTDVTDWGVLGPYVPATEAAEIKRQKELRDRDVGYGFVFDCLCPSCNLEAARNRFRNLPEPPAAAA